MENREKIIGEMRNFFRINGITQTDIAEALGKKQSYVSGVLTGKVGISPQMAQALSEEYGFNTEFLLYGDGSLTNNSGNINIKSSGSTINANTGICSCACSSGSDEMIMKLLNELIEERKLNRELLEKLARNDNKD